MAMLQGGNMAYIGGKGGAGVAQTIINQMPPHEIYIEPFLGAGAVLRNKRPAARTIGIERDANVLARLWRGDEIPGLTLIAGDAFAFLEGYQWAGGELVYLDPPYLRSARRQPGRDYYQNELSDSQHTQLLAIAKQLPGPVLISGYANELYSAMLSAWRCITFTAQTRGGPALECLWLNYPEPAALHDYRYLGDNFREREKLARRRRNWKARLARMSMLERRALLAALAEL